MARPRVFISFDWDNDKKYKFLLEAWNANADFEFVFRDATPDEINSENVGRVKAAISTRIQGATHALVIVGRDANKLHKDWKLIGFKNWINFEVHQAKVYKKKIVAVKIDRQFVSPDELLSSGTSWAMAFDQQPIIRALREA